jgi:hypothetical protein
MLGVQTERQQTGQGRSIAFNPLKALRRVLGGDESVSPLEKRHSSPVRQMDSSGGFAVSWLE